jgi:hypothetical protein
MTEKIPTYALKIYEAKQAWSEARPLDAMRILADTNHNAAQRYYHLKRWGLTNDDAYWYASDSFLAVGDEETR